VQLIRDFGAQFLGATPSYALNISEVADGMGNDHVAYKHLTLPTVSSVLISVVAVSFNKQIVDDRDTYGILISNVHSNLQSHHQLSTIFL